MEKRVAYWGFYSNFFSGNGGGEVKTKSVYEALKQSACLKIKIFNTKEWKRKIPIIPFWVLQSVLLYKQIVIVAGDISFKRLLSVFGIFRVLKKIHYIPVGRINDAIIQNNKRFRENLGKIKGIYVQTEAMKESLNKYGINNVYVMHNFKFLTRKSLQEYHHIPNQPYNFCFCGRVNEEKGILDAIYAFDKLNKKQIIATLDIYGKIDNDFRIKFVQEQSKRKEYIHYLGVLNPEEVADKMQQYYMLVFPTKFQGEGFPGVLLDAFAAGLPVLSSKFEYYNNILEDQNTSVSYRYNDAEDLYKKLVWSINNPVKINEMRANCYNEFEKYTPEKEIEVLIGNL